MLPASLALFFAHVRFAYCLCSVSVRAYGCSQTFEALKIECFRGLSRDLCP